MLSSIRGALLGAAFSLLVSATAAVCYPQETVDRSRIHALETEVSSQFLKTADHEGRIIRLEDAVMSIRDDLAENKWWERGIGGALLVAVLERILRTAGVLKQSSEGGPVG